MHLATFCNGPAGRTEEFEYHFWRQIVAYPCLSLGLFSSLIGCMPLDAQPGQLSISHASDPDRRANNIHYFVKGLWELKNIPESNNLHCLIFSLLFTIEI